jgi:hypothetical protein
MGTHCTREWLAQHPVWMGAENLVNTGPRSTNGTDHSELLYRLSYPTFLQVTFHLVILQKEKLLNQRALTL